MAGGYQAGRPPSTSSRPGPTGPARRQLPRPASPPTSRPRLDALLLEPIAALAGLFTGRPPRQPPSLTRHRREAPQPETCRNIHTERCRTHVQTTRPLTHARRAGSGSARRALEHPGFGGDSILPRCSGLGGRCLPRYRRMAEPRSDHFSAFVLSNICPAALSSCPRLVAGSARQAPRRGVGISSPGTRLCAAGSPGWARVTRSVIACDAGGALDLGGGSVAPVPRPARRCPPAAAPVLTCRGISEEGRGPGRSPGGCGRSPPG